MKDSFKRNFTQQEPIPEEAINAALDVLRSGRLHRYNLLADETSQVALLEKEFAESVGAKYCLAVASGGYALSTALRALGTGVGDNVLTNAFTLAPVPGAIVSIGANPIYIDVNENLVIDFDHLIKKADQANVLLLSHMRGHMCDMDKLMEICNANNLLVVEDCAHTMGAKWGNTGSGRFGSMGCFSTQTYKHLNSGEGGLIITDDPALIAKAVLLSGSYMFYDRHISIPDEQVFESIRYETPNISGRMDNLRAAILRPQLEKLPEKCMAWNDRYNKIKSGLGSTPGLTIPVRPASEFFVGSSFQFLLLDWSSDLVQVFITNCSKRGVDLKWFGATEPSGFTSRYDSWRYVRSQNMPKTDRILTGLVDMRIPLTFSLNDCEVITRIINEEVIRLI